MIKCIIFDVGGVLFSNNIDPVFRSLNKKIRMDAFDRTSAFTRRYVRGKISVREYYDTLSRKAGVDSKTLQSMSISEFKKFTKKNKSVIQIAKTLKKKGYRTGIVSNVSEEHKNIIKKQSIYSIFHPVVLSCDVGYMKPGKKIFTIFLRKAKLKPNECIFIDDRKEHLHYPESLGIKTIHFRNAKQLARDLNKYGVRL